MVFAGLCQRWSICWHPTEPVFIGAGVAAGLLLAAIAVACLLRQIQTFREWRAARLARLSRRPAEPAARRIDAAGKIVCSALVHEALRDGERQRRCPAEDLQEPEWVAFLEAGAAPARRRVLKTALPRKPPSDVIAAFDAAEAAFAAGAAIDADAASAVLIGHFSRSGLAYVTLMLSCRAGLRLRALGRPELAEPYVAQMHRAAQELGCAPGRMLAALLSAQRGLEQASGEYARHALSDCAGLSAAAPIELQIVAADLGARAAELAGNFARVRTELQRRLELEQKLARTGRGRRLAAAHHLADLGRLELLETRYVQGRRHRASGRRAERLLRASARHYLAARDGSALALAYTRLAMAKVSRHHLRAARVWAQRGRRMAAAARAGELVAAADDLLARIETEREARRDWLPAFLR